MENFVIEALPWLIPIIVVMVIWDAVWKMIAMWKSARNNHLVWFIFLGIINSLGILPIIYILTHKNKA